MPTYTYQCKKCHHTFDLFHGMSAAPRVKCTQCGAAGCKRLLGTGAGIIFKGSGFYETDYKKSGASGAGGGESKSESKNASKSESKSESKGAAKSETKTTATS